MAWVMKLEELRVLACPGRAAKAPQVQVLLQALLSLGLVPAGSVGLPGPAAKDWAGEPELAQAHCCPVPGSGCCCCGCLGTGPAEGCRVQPGHWGYLLVLLGCSALLCCGQAAGLL
jgi:hypothetical protein